VRKPYGDANTLFNSKSFNKVSFNHPRPDSGPDAGADALKDDSNMKHKILREFDSYAEEKIDWEDCANAEAPKASAPQRTSERTSGREEVYKTTCFKDLVCQTYTTLEQIYDHQMEDTMSNTTKPLRSPFKNTLEGYEYMGVVSAKHVLTRREVHLHTNGAAWLPLIKRIHAVTLFGKHFGDLYQPADGSTRSMCRQWKSAPRGQEYLVAPVSFLKEIKQNSIEEGDVDESTDELVEGITWCPTMDAFKHCGPGCKHVVLGRVQQLSLKGKQPVKACPADSICPSNSAVIFGKDSILNQSKLQQTASKTLHPSSAINDSGLGTSIESTISTRISPSNSDSSHSDPRIPSQTPERLGAASSSSSGREILHVKEGTSRQDKPNDPEVLSKEDTLSQSQVASQNAVCQVIPTNDNDKVALASKKRRYIVWQKLTNVWRRT
tara:strand:- start:4470 stop:5780 length:1311 start_codon:yes stop_codon:yes gene_type:complete